VTPYLWGWVVMVVSGLGLLLALQRALRGWEAPLLKTLVGWWLLVIVLVPAQVPRHTDELAPALIVFSFETFFQRNGSAGPAGRILATASVIALALGLITYLVGRFRRRGAAAA